MKLSRGELQCRRMRFIYIAKVGFIKHLYNMRPMLDVTQPTRRLDHLQPVRALPVQKRKTRRSLPLVLIAFLLIYFLAPLRTNILLLGTDDSPERGIVGRTDTIILTTVVPLRPYIGMLSIPRDLWVSVPGVGEQRINTAYFFAESNRPGSGPRAAMQTIRENFGVPVRYYAVIHMYGLISMVDALGGVDINLEAPMGGFLSGTHHLDGNQALAFVRERASSDDFSRMLRAQVLLKSVLAKGISPSHFIDLPQFVFSFSQVIDTNIPLWQWPCLLFALLRAFILGVDTRTITRAMVNPFQTSQGAQVLAPDWEAIQPLLKEMFGR